MIINYGPTRRIHSSRASYNFLKEKLIGYDEYVGNPNFEIVKLPVRFQANVLDIKNDGFNVNNAILTSRYRNHSFGYQAQFIPSNGNFQQGVNYNCPDNSSSVVPAATASGGDNNTAVVPVVVPVGKGQQPQEETTTTTNSNTNANETTTDKSWFNDPNDPHYQESANVSDSANPLTYDPSNPYFNPNKNIEERQILQGFGNAIAGTAATLAGGWIAGPVGSLIGGTIAESLLPKTGNNTVDAIAGIVPAVIGGAAYLKPRPTIKEPPRPSTSFNASLKKKPVAEPIQMQSMSELSGGGVSRPFKREPYFSQQPRYGIAKSNPSASLRQEGSKNSSKGLNRQKREGFKYPEFKPNPKRNKPTNAKAYTAAKKGKITVLGKR